MASLLWRKEGRVKKIAEGADRKIGLEERKREDKKTYVCVCGH